MKKKKIIVFGLFVALALVAGFIFFLNRATGPGSQLDNYPYEPDTPAPDPHNGVFVSEHGKMTFNGDGKTVVYDFDEELSKLCNLPSGEHEGTYVFLSGDLPPHGSIDVRYDIAHEWEIRVDDTASVIQLGLATPDGKSASVGVDVVTETRIPLLFNGDKFVTITFEKE
ncbi:MAG: hypothetical protein IJI66_08610 [Erysipelotrichaceae bacterium]|nr:hypothetical protein [Erysipelotrichaceae bacterium]